MQALLISLVIFLFFGVIVSIIIFKIQSDRRKKLMMAVRKEIPNSSELHNYKKDKDQRKSDLAKKLKETDAQDLKKKGITLSEMIMQAGFSTSVPKFWLNSAIFCVLFTGFFILIGSSKFVVVMMAFTSFLGLPRMFLKRKAKKRQKLFMDDFADSLEAMIRLLKAGMPVTEAIKMVAREFTGPMGEEMERIFDEQQIGVPLPEAVLAASKRMPLTEMQMFATAISIQTQTGSSLSEVLQNLAGVIRSRYKLKRKIMALSAEAKASAMIVGALPIFVGLGMYFVNYDYIIVLFTTPQGKFLLGIACGWMFLGTLVMRQMINFKV